MSYKRKPNPPLANGNFRDKIENFKKAYSNFKDNIPFMGGDGLDDKIKNNQLQKDLAQKISKGAERIRTATAKYKAAKAKVNKK